MSIPPTREELVAEYGEPDSLALDGVDSGCPTNARKVGWARAGLHAFVIACKQNDDIEGNVSDLVTDLLHLACAEGVDPLEILRRAERDFLAEAGMGYEGVVLESGETDHPFVRKPHRSQWAGCATCGEVHA